MIVCVSQLRKGRRGPPRGAARRRSARRGPPARAAPAPAARSPIPVSVSADGIGRYSQIVETAIYFCCLEALQNAAKHASEASARVRVWEESGGLLFSV